MFKGKFLPFALAMAFLIGIAIPVNAETRMGSMTVDFVTKDVTNDKKMNLDGAVFEIWKVADIEISEADDGAIITLANEFKETNINLEGLSAEESNEAAKDFAKVAKESKAVGTIESGSTKFENLEKGIYLVQQTQANGISEKYTKVEPFLVSVPMYQDGQWVYDVKTQPKTGVIKNEPDEPTEEPPTDTTTPPTDPPKDPTKPPAEPPKEPTKPPAEEIDKGGGVQTDDDILSNVLTWGGIIVLSVGAIGLIYYSKRKTKK